MKLKGMLIVVKDSRKSAEFYSELFGLTVLHDYDGNIEMSGGLFLQEEKYWKSFLGREIVPGSNQSELYFETEDVAAFDRKLRESKYEIDYVNPMLTHSWGQTVIRFYDPDGNLIEVGSPT